MDTTIGRARVVRFYPNRSGGGFGFLGVRLFHRGLFFHTANGRKMNPEGTEFLEERETTVPTVDDVIVYCMGKGRQGPEAVVWAFAPGGSGLL